MLIILSDKSAAELFCKTLHFKAIEPSRRDYSGNKEASKAPFGINCKALATFMSDPKWRFGDCFRRVSDRPRYSPKQSVHEFDLSFITSIYKFRGYYQGGTFCSSTTEWHFLDGGIVSHNGYGWGSHSWTVVEGTESLRAVCLFFGIKQPQSIKGETERRPLSILLEEMTSAPIQKRRGRLWNMPEPLNSESPQSVSGKDSSRRS